MDIIDACKDIELAIDSFKNASPLTLRDHVLNVYAELKRRIDNGELIDAFVTDARVDEKGEIFINFDLVKPAQIIEINVSVELKL